MDFRPLSDWVLVAIEPAAARSDILVSAGESSVRKGRVLSVGPGKPMKRGVAAPELKKGDRVAFFRWHNEHRPGKAVAGVLAELGQQLGEDLMAIRTADVLFVMDDCDPAVDV